MNRLTYLAFPSLSRFGKGFLSVVGTVGGGLYVIGDYSTEGDAPSSSAYHVQAKFRTSLCQVAAVGTVAWEFFRGALNPFASIECQPSEEETESSPSNEAPEVTFAGKVATVLASLTVDASCRDILLGIGGSFLVEWLIKKATEEEQGTIEQEKSQQALLNFLSTGRAGHMVLSHPRAIPQLLLQAANSSDNDLTEALERALESSSCCPRNIPQGDIQDVLTLVKGRHGGKIQHIAALCLKKWCESSLVNCQMVASMGGAEIIASVANSMVGQGEAKREMQCDLASLMSVLARDSPSKSELCMERWVSPLLYILAEALALQDSNLANSMIHVMGTCAASGLSKVHEAILDSHLWPLLKRLQNSGKQEFVQCAISAIGSLSAEGVVFPPDEWEYWTKELLRLIVVPSMDDQFGALCSKALTGLASSAPNAAGLHVARLWLGEFIVALSEILPTPDPDAFPPAKVVPSYARYVAAEVQGLTIPGEGYSDPPDHIGESVLYRAGRALDWVEEDGDRGTPTSRALRVLCDLVADHEEMQEWLVAKGLLRMMQRVAGMGWDGGEAHGGLEECPASVQEQLSRLLAIVSRGRVAQRAMEDIGWMPWLEIGLTSKNISIASACSKSILHVRNGWSEESCSPVFHDGIHLFNPTAQHHWKLSQQMETNSSRKGDPLVDVVFVHGIRGGAFVTWRKDDTDRELSSKAGSCWPSSWLATDVPQARLIGLEYAAPVSGWEGESPPFRETAHALLKRLMDAGVGSRPVIFVAHSMGGIMVKEMLAHALGDQGNASLAQFLGNTSGLIFYSTPHHGTWLADLALNLKHIGASPAQSLHFLKPGPYLVDLNRAIQEWSEKKRLPILHFSESKPTKLLPVIPKLLIVPPESACPAFGESVRLAHADHVRACKPSGRDSISYSKTMELIRTVAMEVE